MNEAERRLLAYLVKINEATRIERVQDAPQPPQWESTHVPGTVVRLFRLDEQGQERELRKPQPPRDLRAACDEDYDLLTREAGNLGGVELWSAEMMPL